MKITVNPLPNPFAGNDTVICKGRSVVIGKDSVSGNLYSWNSLPTGFSSTISKDTITASVTTTYFLTETIKATGCNKTDSVFITVKIPPGVNAGNDTSVCIGISSVSLNGNISGITKTGQWTTLGSGTFSPSDTSLNVIYNLSSDDRKKDSVIVILTSTNNDVCSAVYDSTTIYMDSIPSVNAGKDTLICKGSSILLHGSGGSVKSTYLWTPGNTLNDSTIANPIATLSSATTYVLRIANRACARTDTLFIETQAPSIYAGADVTITADKDTAMLIATGGISYVWNPGIGLNDSTISTPIAKPSITTIYIVTGMDSLGCKNTDTLIVTVLPNNECGELFIPDAFSPNDNHKNDMFRVRMKTACIKDIVFDVYDRWGEKIYETTNVAEATENGWDGTYKGKKLNTGVFVFSVKVTFVNGGEVKKQGTFSLIK